MVIICYLFTTDARLAALSSSQDRLWFFEVVIAITVHSVIVVVSYYLLSGVCVS